MKTSKITMTISVLAAVSLMAACGSKKSAPPAAGKTDAAPTTEAPVKPGAPAAANDKGAATTPTVPGTVPSAADAKTNKDGKAVAEEKKMIPGNFTGVSVACDQRAATDESVKKFKGTILDLKEDTSYTSTELVEGDATPPSELGTFTVTPDVEKSEMGQITFQESLLSFGTDPAPVTGTYSFKGDVLIINIEDKALCPTEKFAVKTFKRTSAVEAKKATTPVSSQEESGT